jgi:hypothetical protein
MKTRTAYYSRNNSYSRSALQWTREGENGETNMITPHNNINLASLIRIYEDHTGQWTARCLSRHYDTPSAAAMAVRAAVSVADDLASIQYDDAHAAEQRWSEGGRTCFSGTIRTGQSIESVATLVDVGAELEMR